MNEELGIPIAKTINEEIFSEEEIKEIEDLKEISDLMKTTTYKIVYNAFMKAIRKSGKELIDYAMEKGFLNKTAPGEIKSEKNIPDKKDKIEFVDVAIIKDYSEKSYKLWNEEGLVAYIPKSAIKETKDKRLYLTTKAKNWYIPEWKEDK